MKATTNAVMFDLETVERLIASSRPRRRWLGGRQWALLGLGAVLGAYLADESAFARAGLPAWLMVQILLVVLAALLAWSALRQRRRAKLTRVGFEAVLLRQWDQARAALMALLGRPVVPRQTRAEALLGVASLAETEHEYEAAQRVYEALLEERQGDPIQLHTARVALAAVMLRTGQTADAVQLIDELARAELPGALRVQIEMLTLFREVAMGQTADGVSRAEERRELFRRHLSTRAGFGYGLLAAAFERAGQPDSARRYWHDATLLIPPQELLDRFEELATVAQKYPAAEFAL